MLNKLTGQKLYWKWFLKNKNMHKHVIIKDLGMCVILCYILVKVYWIRIVNLS
jgi:hypothetical protein